MGAMQFVRLTALFYATDATGGEHQIREHTTLMKGLSSKVCQPPRYFLSSGNELRRQSSRLFQEIGTGRVFVCH